MFAGFDVFGMPKDGEAIEAPARFTFVTKGGSGLADRPFPFFTPAIMTLKSLQAVAALTDKLVVELPRND